MTVADFTAVVNGILPEPHAGLLNGIIFGTKATISKDLYDALVQTGTLHIIALSGMNITILTNLVGITLLRFVSRRIASLLTIIIIIGFILFVGVSASVVRAGIMGSLALLAVVFGRQTWSLLFLILAACGMLLVNPTWIADIGFQLSVFATLGIILFGKKITKAGPAGLALRSQKNLGPSSVSLTLDHSRGALKKVNPDQIFSLPAQYLPKSVFVFLWPLIEDDLRVTLAAQTFTIPLILFHFHRISLISPLTNILIGWTIAPITMLGLAASVLGRIWMPLGLVIGWVVWVPLQYMLLAIWITSTIPFASLAW